MSSQRTNLLTLSELRKKVAWLFYGTREYNDLDGESRDTVDDIINDGYERFLNPPAAPGDRKPHRWNFLRPYFTLTTVSGKDDYGLPEDFGGLDGPMYYQRSDNRWFPVSKVDANKILAQRQTDSLPTSSYPTEFAIVADYPNSAAPPSSMLMLWPNPDAAYHLKARYYVIAGMLSEEKPYPVCPATHNQCLQEAVLSVAEERLEDTQGIHHQNFMERLQSSVSIDRDQYSPDHLPVDADRSDDTSSYPFRYQGNYVTYNGYTPGA